MVGADIDRIAAGLERMISEIDEGIEDLRKRELNSPIHAQMIMARGRIFKDLAIISSNKEELLGYAIGALTEAVNMYNKLRIEHESARAHYELALTYMELSKLKDHDRNRDIAIRALDEAKVVINYDDDPDLYRMIDEKLKEIWKE
jgi:hypothetical protein